jgi:hypothetical protein
VSLRNAAVVAAGSLGAVAPAVVPKTPPAVVVAAPECQTPAGVLAIAGRNAGLPPDRVLTAVAIAGAESGFRLEARKVEEIESSFGPWQVNRDAHPQYTADDLMTADGAARAMGQISGNGSTWQPWTGWFSGAYTAHLAEAEAVAHCAGATPTGPANGTGVVGGPAPPAQVDVDGLAGRVIDRLTYKAIKGWGRFGRWLTGRQPDTQPLVDAVDRQVADLTDVTPTTTTSPTTTTTRPPCLMPAVPLQEECKEP